jgi:hypothetical protein
MDSAQDGVLDRLAVIEEQSDRSEIHLERTQSLILHNTATSESNTSLIVEQLQSFRELANSFDILRNEFQTRVVELSAMQVEIAQEREILYDSIEILNSQVLDRIEPASKEIGYSSNDTSYSFAGNTCKVTSYCNYA